MSSHPAPGTKSPTKKDKFKFFQGAFEGGVDLLSAVRSRDRPTRRMGIYLWITIALAFLVTGLALRRYWAYQQEESAARSLALALEKQHQDQIAEEKHSVARVRESTAELGTFTSTVPPPADDTPGSRLHAYVSADIDLSVRCDSPGTRKFVDSHQDQARNQATQILGSLQRDELLTVEGKRQTRSRLVRRLNRWLEKNGVDGKVVDVAFTELVVH